MLSPTPTLPLLGVPYVSGSGALCFATAGLCATNGSIELTSVLSSTFNLSGQDIVAAATYTATLTTLSMTPLGPIALTGTLEQEVLGRTFSTELGSWTTDIVTLSLSGPVEGHTLNVGLDGSQTSSGMASIVAAGNMFSINSFFDVFLELGLDRVPPLRTDTGPIHLEPASTSVPEPGSIVILISALSAMGATRLARRAVT